MDILFPRAAMETATAMALTASDWPGPVRSCWILLMAAWESEKIVYFRFQSSAVALVIISLTIATADGYLVDEAASQKEKDIVGPKLDGRTGWLR